MNLIAEQLVNEITRAENKENNMQYRMNYHLMPPVGWLNDPNGLCQFKGEYHFFFQYSPLDATGGMKAWGHYTSKDLIHFTYLGTPILPDHEWDKDGVYSGSALIDGDEMLLYYTGNIKNAGEYDYIHDGRESNTILITSKDGRHFSEKQRVLETKDYPETYTKHIRDPKVFKKDGKYYMVLGGRLNTEHGAVLVYESDNKLDWSLVNEITTKEAFGYMWECPDIIPTDEKWFLSISPQGIEAEEYRYQNIYQAGYFIGTGDYCGKYHLGEFIEWDMGFDFYAPQTFVDESGRRILIGWAGLPDIEPEYTNKTIESGWQHSFTVPRVITNRDGKLYQYPVAELKGLRFDMYEIEQEEDVTGYGLSFDLVINDINDQEIRINIAEDMQLEYMDGICELRFMSDMGAGRTVRKAIVENVDEIRVLCDNSIAEFYINKGEIVFTTRFYCDSNDSKIQIDCKHCNSTIWKMNEMEVR